ncbi:hypothetical protein CBF_2337 [Clostridium botulinum F str. 230613]|uniref:Uncharacterized protein n=1 Tax=Clostridium botulinum (strain Langeland / NCTC 10281 / Type F) TaxID=441772 RepID=A7GFN6_CLOBL|nr:hypothetical protein CLI_2347 [Clostridium botulinum F str. Langeland]ADG00002.1 hypothetical protein CBF_2337 [Clostridium botulinum F str. 230613]
MNQGQEKFLGFILEKVKEDRIEEVQTVMEQFAENFSN